MYRGERYWEQETPQDSRTGKVWLSYFPQAGKLQVSTIWHGEDGPKRGKTVTLDVEGLALHNEARGLLSRFVMDAVEEAGGHV